MAGGMYMQACGAFMRGEIDLEDDDIVALLIDTDEYTADLDTDEFLDVVNPDAIIATSLMTGRVVENDTFDADDTVWEDVTGPVCEAIVLYKDTGDPATSPLIAYFDNDNVPELPVTPNGTHITIVWDDGPTKVLRLMRQGL